MGEHGHWFMLIPGFSNVEHQLVELLGIESTGHVSLYHVFMALFVVLLIVALLTRAGLARLPADERVVPEDKLSARTFFELVVEALLGVMRDIIGPTAPRYLPLVGTLAVFILFGNLLGLVPGFQPPTSNFNTTFALAVPVFFATHYYGVKEHGLAYFKHFFGPILKWYALPLMLLMLIIETISHLVRPVSLALRLMGNMIGDHTVLSIFMGLVSIPLLFPVPVLVLGTIVCIVQALVFCLLSTVYIGLAVAHEEH